MEEAVAVAVQRKKDQRADEEVAETTVAVEARASRTPRRARVVA